MVKKFSLLLLPVFFLVHLHGQDFLSVSGSVSDENDQPLPGANIYFPELEKGAISDREGKFIITGLPKGKFVVHISYIGYETDIRSIFLSEQDPNLNVKMIPSMVTGKEVVISGGRHASQHKNAVKIELLKVKSIQQNGLTGVVDNLTVLPGVDRIGNGGGLISPVIRGLSTSNILMLNNGIRLENYQFSSDHPYLVDESGINQVEIIKGPASMLYGSDAIGGIINIVDDYRVEPYSISGEANLRYLSNPNGYTGSLGIHGNHGMVSWSLHGGTKNSMDYTDGESQQVINSRFTGHSIKSYAGFRFDNSLHRLRYEYQKFKPGMVNEGSTLLVTDNKRSHEFWYQDLDNHLLSVTNSWFINRIKINVNGSYQKNLRKLITDEPGHHTVDMDLTTFSYETRGSLVSSEISEFTLSVQGLNQQNRNREGEIRVLPDYGLNDIGLFGLVQHDFENNIHLQVGLRFDNRFLTVPTQEKAAHSHEEHDPSEEPEILEGFDRYFGNVSGSLGATFELAEGVLLRSNIASAYRAPNMAELTQDGEHGIRYELGNRDLKSQRNYEFDLSLHYHREKLMVDLAGFYNHINDYIFLSYTTDTTDEGLSIYRYLQNNATLYGFEGLMEIHPLEDLGIKMAYNFTRGVQAGGENLPFIPHNKLLSEVKYSFPRIVKKGILYLKIGADYAFSQDRPSRYESATPSWFLLHTGAGLDIPMSDHMLSFSLQVRNILDTAYIDHLSVLKGMNYYNMGRNIVLSLSLPFHLHLAGFENN
jgi:iron complex outermembrane receptor protein